MTETNYETGCIEGYKEHHYPEGQTYCSRCGLVKSGAKVRTSPYATRQNTKSTSTSKKSTAEPSFNKSEARDGIAMLILASQTVILSARPEFKEDALNARERMMLADALAEEAYYSTTIRRFVAKLGQQKKHTKLAMVCMALMIPRLARHGLIPQEGMEELANELVTTSNPAAGSNGSGTGESEPDFESIPVESGGSPFTNRGNGIGENNVSGVAVETTPIRNSVADENGRREVQYAGSGEVASVHVESEIEPDRIKTGSATRRPKKGRIT